jgi:cyclic beta-1,2-glucan synthetase
MELFHLINPINHMRTVEDAERYKAEPYAVAADVYAHPMHVGRGGWSWYTGSAGWMYQAAVQALLGVRRSGATMSISPCIPTVWPEYSLTWKIGGSRYRFEVTNPDRLSHGMARAQLDGVDVDHDAIPIADDGREHVVSVRLEARSSVVQAGAAASGRSITGR